MVRDRLLPRALLASLALSALVPGPARSQDAVPPGGQSVPAQELVQGVDIADVRLDGRILFPIRGIKAYPAARRAAEIADRIRDAARDPGVLPSDVRQEETEEGIRILVGDRPIMDVYPLDASIEGVTVGTLARIYSTRVGEAIDDWRSARASGHLLASVGFVVAGGLLLFLLLFLLHRLHRALSGHLERRLKRSKGLSVQSTQLVRADRIRTVVRATSRYLTIGVAILLTYAYLNAALEAFPWTRGFARALLRIVLQPVVTIGRGVVSAIPGLVFILIAALFTRFLLGLIRTYFRGLARGTTRLRGFEPEWAKPTYRLVKLGVIVLFLVMIYPYIPGSSSGAFKGISLFLGVVFSLGSTSVIGNVVSGQSIQYRRAFRVGDRVEIDGVLGDVQEIRLLVTHLRTPKNEEVVVPNSLISTGRVTNYSSIAEKHGLILHTTVGIGYETPWRQVEAMLREAAGRTPGLEAEPPPFVLQKALGDFAVTYEINAWTNEPKAMLATYAALHANIQDVFNEYGVQIMTPAYERDPESPKVVRPEDWYAAPARRDADAEAAPEAASEANPT